MRFSKYTISLAFLFRSVPASSITASDDDNTTCISQLPEQTPARQKHLQVVPLYELSLMNPEETGGYFEGDIMLPDGIGVVGFNDSKRWPKATVPYVIEGSYTLQHRKMILQAMNIIQLLTCIKFVPRSDQSDYVAIHNNKHAGCSSYIGRTGGAQVVNLEAPFCFAKIGTALHELLHTIGLLHEHNRPDRDKYITVDKCNLQNGKKKYFKIYASATKAGKDSDQNNIEEHYDYNSVMHYTEYAGSSNRNVTIISKVNGFMIGQRDGLSIKDVKTIANMYNCNKPENNTIELKLAKNLRGITPYEYTYILQMRNGSVPAHKFTPSERHFHGKIL